MFKTAKQHHFWITIDINSFENLYQSMIESFWPYSLHIYKQNLYLGVDRCMDLPSEKPMILVGWNDLGLDAPTYATHLVASYDTQGYG